MNEKSKKVLGLVDPLLFDLIYFVRYLAKKFYFFFFFSTKFQTLEWVSKFGEQLYPVITCQLIQVDSILRDLEGSRRRILPELNKAVDELDARIKSIDNLVEKGIPTL